MNDERLKCKFCNWTTRKVRKNKFGKFQDVDEAQERLVAHVKEGHPEEHKEVLTCLDDLGY